MTSLFKSVLGGGSALPPKGASTRAGRQPVDFTPLPWSNYFKSSSDLILDNYCDASFRTYSGGNPEASLMVVLLHGGGYSALTWAIFASELSKRTDIDCLAIDLRGHGHSHTSNDADLSAATMCQDIEMIVNREKQLKAEKGVAVSGVVLIGHSMGGALAVRVASHNLIEGIVGVVVIDVVEGSAVEALGSMQAVLKSRPQSFPCVDAAIAWSLKSGQTRNHEAARVSMPGQVVEANATDLKVNAHQDVDPSPGGVGKLDEIAEESEETAESTEKAANPEAKTPPTDKKIWVWRIDLSKTEKYWPGWFESLSKLFLSLTCPRVLVLAGIDRLDKDLIVGQMQGKFQLQVLEKVGHAVHEDAPGKLADVIATFLVRNKLATAIGSFSHQFPCC